MKSNFNTKRLVLLGVLAGILLLMSFTPIGYLNVGLLAISLNMIPVAIGAIAAGPVGGAVLGAIFGVTSCLQCVGIGGTSAMGVMLFEISPVLALIQRFVPRLLAGWLSGWVYVGMRKLTNTTVACFATGFSAALANTVLFMTALITLFSRTEYLQNLINGRNILVFVCTFVGVNAVIEMLASMLIVGTVGTALRKANLIGGK